MHFLSSSSSVYVITGVAAVELTLRWFVRLALRHMWRYPCCSFMLARCSFMLACCKFDALKNVETCAFHFWNSTGVKSIFSLSGLSPSRILTCGSMSSCVILLALTGFWQCAIAGRSWACDAIAMSTTSLFFSSYLFSFSGSSSINLS